MSGSTVTIEWPVPKSETIPRPVKVTNPGFYCFSMRFIVMIDLLSTIIQSVSVAYVRT